MKSRTLGALAGALAALPAYQSGAAETGYRFSRYAESDLPGSRTASGERESRYDIQTHQLEDSRAVGRGWTLDSDLMIEAMSGASPWFVLPSASRGAVQVMSGASIREERYALSAQLQRDPGGDRRWSLNLGLSDEDDYTAYSAGMQWEWDNADRSRTWSAGLGLSDDHLNPTDGGSERFPERIVSADKQTWQAVGGVSQVLTPSTVAQASLAVAQDSGYLSDPYKLVFVDGDTEPDTRPRSRDQLALTLRLRHYLRALGAALTADWRHFRDDWDIHSDTIELGLIGRLRQVWRWSGSLRYYQQSQADFYGPFFDEAPASGRYSSDYRLSPYGAISLRLGWEYRGRDWSAGLAYERYDSDADYAPGSVRLANPGLVDFNIISVVFAWHLGGRAGAPLLPPETDLRVIPPEDA